MRLFQLLVPHSLPEDTMTFFPDHDSIPHHPGTMRRLLLLRCALLLSTLLLAGCSSSKPEQPRQKAGYIMKPYIGAVPVSLASGAVLIQQVSKSGSAEEAGIRAGDTVFAIDGTPVRDRYAFLLAVLRAREGGRLRFQTSRAGKRTEVDVVPRFVNETQDNIEILKLLWQEKNVRLAVVCDEINNVLLKDPVALDQWKKGAATELLASNERRLLNAFASDTHFVLLDRNRIEQVANELKLSSSGLVSQEFTAKLGSMLGATHLLTLGLSRFSNSEGRANDTFTRRLIEIESGRVLASVAYYGKK